MPTAPVQPVSPFSRVVSILAAGVVRLWDGEVGESGDLAESAGNQLERPEHVAISVPGGERAETGESRLEVSYGG